jgi:hypothetical protein
MTIIYHLDPGDESDDAALRWKRELGRDADRQAGEWPDDTDTTW